MKGLIHILICLTAVCSAGPLHQPVVIPPAGSVDAAPLHRAEKALTDVMVHDIFSPPVASRIYLYTNVAAYEVLVKAYPGSYRSLYGQVRNFPNLPAPREKIDGSLAAVYALMVVGKKLIFSEPVLEDSLQAILAQYRAEGISGSVYDA